ncbi:MAG TPA: hypothetical protein ENN03_12005 [bacterium]|nr:hypothetical protein [bacterium]
MTVDISSLTLEQALSVAIRSEMDSVAIYKKLKDMVKNFVMKDKLDFLIGEETKHQQIVSKLFEKRFPGKEVHPTERGLVPKLSFALDEENTVTDLLEMAMESEKVSGDFYDRLAEEVDEKGVKEILQYLSIMEYGHYSLLKGEYDLCMRDEEYYERGDFQYDMVHIGP